MIDDGIRSGGTQAFVNIAVFDKNHDFLDAAWDKLGANLQICEMAGETGTCYKLKSSGL